MTLDNKLQRANIEMAEQTGLLNYEKMLAGAPMSWKLVKADEVAAILAAGLPFIPRVVHVQGPIAQGWSPAYAYDLIVKWEEVGCEQYAGLSLAEWLKKTTSGLDSQPESTTI